MTLSVHCQGDFHHSQPIHALSTELCKIEILYLWQESRCAYVLSVHRSVPRGMYARDFGVGENEPGAIWLKYWRLIRHKPHNSIKTERWGMQPEHPHIMDSSGMC